MFIFAVLVPLLQSPAQGRTVTRVTIEPGNAAVQLGDTLRLTARAFDAEGQIVSDARVRWFQAGSRFEGGIDSTGLLTARATGTIVATALVGVAGGGRPVTATARITVLSQPASRIVIEPAVAHMLVGQSVALAATPYAPNDDRRYDPIRWSVDDPGIAQVTATGRLVASRSGKVTVTAKAGQASQSFTVTVAPNTLGSVALTPATTAARTGDVVKFTFTAKTKTGQPIGDALPQWSFAPGNAQIDPDGGFVAEVPGTYRVMANFAGQTADAIVEVRPRDAARPTTLVGRLPIKALSGEFWLHPDGKHGYLTTIGLTGVAGDRLYAIDVTDPGDPRITDSVMVDARVINDVMTTEDGKYGVMTREGASNRKNGIAILSFEDPAHPKQIAEFTETVSGGVHSTYIYKGYVFLTDDATGSMRVIDIRDPYHPKQVARWETLPPTAGRTVHDIDVKDGLAYLSYWNDGLIILDVGNGIKGGRPDSPQFVSSFKYDLNALYRDVEAEGGPGFIRGTHTAWRAGKYVFVADEVFPAIPSKTQSAGVPGLGRAFGRMQVVDVSDLMHPKSVAYYEPKDGGTHNIWVAGDTLYLGDYQGGLRVLDIAGELRGNLLAQGREIAHVHTGDSRGFVQGNANAWGAIYRNGFVYVPDVNSGLWIVKVEPKAQLTP